MSFSATIALFKYLLKNGFNSPNFILKQYYKDKIIKATFYWAILLTYTKNTFK